MESPHLVAIDQARNRWHAFFAENFAPIEDSPIVPELTPFFGTPEYDALSESERRELYLGWIQMNAEIFLALERFLLLAYRARAAEHPKAHRIVVEEFLHCCAFRHFLNREKVLGWPRNALLIGRAPRVSQFITWIVKHIPFAITIPGVKTEIYSLFYSNMMKQSFGGWTKNRWTRLHQLHLQDETFHVPFEFDLIIDEFKSMGHLRRAALWVASFCFFLFLQWVLISSSGVLVRRIFPVASRRRKRELSRKFVRWVLKDFPPYHETARSMRRHLDQKNPPLAFWFRYITW